MPRAAPKPSHVTKCYGLHDPLNPEDSEVQTLGCRHTNPDACKRNGLEAVCAFVRQDGLCAEPSKIWPKQFRRLREKRASSHGRRIGAEDLRAQRGVTVTYETMRQWCCTFGPAYARRRRGRMGDTWHLDELCVNIQGRQQALWRVVDEDGDMLDILVQSRRNRRAAVRFFRKLLKGQGRPPRRLITDKLRSYPAACRTVMPSVIHGTDRYANNRAEVSHQPTRQREQQMRRCKSAAHLQRFASVHGLVLHLFRVGRHLLRSVHHRMLRPRAFAEWNAVTGAC